jgi:P-type conjugative transfer protein TrbJ
MKKILKKLLIGALVVLSTTTIYSKSISIKGITEILKVVTKIYTQQQLMGTEQIQQGMSLITQIENQVRQIENQYTMLKRFSDELAQGNLTHLEDYYREFGYMLDSYDSIMLDTENLSKRYVELFKEKPKEFEKLGFNQDYIEKMDRNIREARQESNTALYDVMTSKGFAAKVGADEQNLKMLLNASKTSTGVVETLQITNSILGQISTNISQLGLLSETANKAQAMSTNTDSQEMENSKVELENAKKTQKLNDQIKMQELINKSKKSIKI